MKHKWCSRNLIITWQLCWILHDWWKHVCFYHNSSSSTNYFDDSSFLIDVMEFKTSSKKKKPIEDQTFLTHSHVIFLICTLRAFPKCICVFYWIVTIIGDFDILYFTHDSAFQVNNLLQVAQRYQAATSGSGPARVSNDEAQTICDMLVNKLFSTAALFIIY
jgi:hypothetical protein